MMAPFLLDNVNVGLLYPSDAIERAKEYMKHVKGMFRMENNSYMISCKIAMA